MMYSIEVLDTNTMDVFTRISDEPKLYDAEWSVLANLYALRPNGNFIILNSKISHS